MTQKTIPFYGATKPGLFEIERRCMDRDGLVIDLLDELMPEDRILDIGAGNGFVGSRLMKLGIRTVVGLEPDPGMIDPSNQLVWCRGVAQEIPFQNSVFNGAYSTWAFFLSGFPDRAAGLSEVSRVVSEGGTIVIVDNAGEDEFCALSSRSIADDGKWYMQRGFSRRILETSFSFDSIEEARKLLSFYFGEEIAKSIEKTRIGFRVAAYIGESGSVG